MTSPQHASAYTTAMSKLIVLEQTYPAWHINQRGGMWSAKRTVSPAQMEAGLHEMILQPTMEALAAVLAQQLYIAQRVRD